MRALVVSELSSDLSGVELRDMPAPARNPGEVLVRVHAASLNFPDLLMTQGKYQFKPELPFVCGLEMAGEVIEAEPGSGFAPGDPVIGGNKTGAFAEIASIPARGLSHLAKGVSFAEGAAMGAACGRPPGLSYVHFLSPPLLTTRAGVGWMQVDLVFTTSVR